MTGLSQQDEISSSDDPGGASKSSSDTNPLESHKKSGSPGRAPGANGSAYRPREVLLEESIRQYRSVVEDQTDFICRYLPDGTVTFANNAYCRYFGHRRVDLVGNLFALPIAHDDRETIPNYLDEFKADNPICTCEHRVITPQGETRWNRWTHRAIFDDSGNLLEFQSVGRDITERKLAEEALKKSEAKYRRLVENSPVGIFTVDDCGRINEANQAFVNILGGPSMQEVVGTDTVTCAPVLEPYFLDDLIAGLEADEPIQLERSWTSRWGKHVYVRVYLVPVRNSESENLGCQGIVEDVTERRTAREKLIQSERLKALGELATGIAHNFNNLLQLVLGAAGLAVLHLDRGLADAARTHLNQIFASARLGAETVKRLQSFARAKSGPSPLQGTVFDLSRIVEQAVEMSKGWWKTVPEKSALKIKVTTAFQQGCMIQGQESELFEVIVNLLKNAVEALGPEGEINVRTSVEGSRVVLAVQDNGAGIPRAHLSKVFDPFFTTKTFDNAGMGLASCYGIVSLHQGDISVESGDGRGTTFTVTLPLTQEITGTGTTVKPSGRVKKLRILVIDDVPIAVCLLEEGLNEWGHTVFKASSGPEGVDLFRSRSVDLVVCDLGMPGMNGWEVGKVIKEDCESRDAAKTPFILLTGWGQQAALDEKRLECGVDKVLEKPVDISTLQQAAQDVVRDWEATHTNASSNK